MNSFDLSIVSFINRFAQRSPTFDQLVVFLSISRLLKGGVIVGILWWVWFENDDVRRKRETLLAAIIASMPGLLIARVLSALIYRARPAVKAAKTEIRNIMCPNSLSIDPVNQARRTCERGIDRA